MRFLKSCCLYSESSNYFRQNLVFHKVFSEDGNSKQKPIYTKESCYDAGSFLIPNRTRNMGILKSFRLLFLDGFVCKNRIHFGCPDDAKSFSLRSLRIFQRHCSAFVRHLFCIATHSENLFTQ
jgi:hypothetical protein